jgi:hypothetical protein
MDEMEVDTGRGSTSEASPSLSSRKLGLKNAIQTNFGQDYVFQIASRYFCYQMRSAPQELISCYQN